MPHFRKLKYPQVGVLAFAGGTAAVALFLTGALTAATGQGAQPGTNAGISAVSALPLVPWDGGPAYWRKFPKADAAGWSSPNFFPIAVYVGKPSHAAALKAVGINTYMGAEHDGSPITTMTSQGMYVIAQDEWSVAEVGNDPKAVGWFISDECDIGLNCAGTDTAGNLADQKAKVSRVRALNDGRFTFANYSNGILGTWWAKGTMPDFLAAVDAASNDKYAYTSPFVDNQLLDSPAWPVGAKPASSAAYGWQVDQMRHFQSPAGVHPNWMFVETAMPLLNDAGSLTIAPAQIEGAVWSAIIHEARGIAYFQHNNGTTCGFYSLVDCDPARLAQIKAINDKVQSLAPVLNTQSYQYSFNTTTDTMLKAYNGSAYIFADLGLSHSTGAKTFTLPAGISGTTVEVVGEGRTLPVANGTFTDTFGAEYTHHVYKVTL